MEKPNLILSLVLIIIGSLAAADFPPSSGMPAGPAEEIHLGLGEGMPGENGWVVSDYTIHVISPVDALINGQPLKDGRFTITSDGRHSVELQPGPNGQNNTIAQFINIDKTAPTVEWT